MAKTSAPTTADMYQKITDAMVTALESDDLAPWHKPWAATDLPTNLQTEKRYRGTNVWILWARQMSQGYKTSYWVTYAQARKLKGNVKPAESKNYVRIVFWKVFKAKDKDTGKDKTIPYMRTFCVYNIEQCEGLELPEVAERTPVEIDDAAEALCEAWPVTMDHGGDRAYYSPLQDRIQLPERDVFESTSEYYSTAFHEIGHSTGHSSRLNRKSLTSGFQFGSHGYSYEELVAELTACFLCAETGVARAATTQNSAAYLKSWAKKLRDDPKLFEKASRDAQKAADEVLIAAGSMERPDWSKQAKAA